MLLLNYTSFTLEYRIKEDTLKNYKLQIEFELVNEATEDERALIKAVEICKIKANECKQKISQLVLEQIKYERDVVELLYSHAPIRKNTNPKLIKEFNLSIN